jgi:coenzyme F420-reducing hydrogenase delta subunit
MGSDAKTKILILATLSGGYAGADSVGQLHTDYASNTYVLPVLSPAMFAESFYLDAFERGIDAIIVMYSGTDCPYKGAAERTAKLINQTYILMKERGIDTRRLRKKSGGQTICWMKLDRSKGNCLKNQPLRNSQHDE